MIKINHVYVSYSLKQYNWHLNMKFHFTRKEMSVHSECTHIGIHKGWSEGVGGVATNE